MPEEQKRPEPPLEPPKTPKDKFLRGQYRKAHELWTDTAAGKAAMEVALAEYVDGLGDNGDSYNSIMAYNRLIGAKQVLRILANLHLSDEQPKQDPWPRLKSPK